MKEEGAKFFINKNFTWRIIKCFKKEREKQKFYRKQTNK